MTISLLMDSSNLDPLGELSQIIDNPPEQPLELFTRWFNLATATESIAYPSAACLSTIDESGFPDGRTVLVERFDTAGFMIFSDTESVKGKALATNPKAALTFYWGPLERQVRVKAMVAQASTADADACFAKRPRESRITAWVSRQSSTMESSSAFEASIAEYQQLFASEKNISRPSNWVAYWLNPKQIEFWQSGEKRLHHRLQYTKTKLGWNINRLYP